MKVGEDEWMEGGRDGKEKAGEGGRYAVVGERKVMVDAGRCRVVVVLKSEVGRSFCGTLWC